MQAIYEYLTKYFAPKPRQRGSCSQADSSESQDHNADLDDADSGPGVAGGEGDGTQTECDPYDAVDPPNSENQALVESQERLCWSLGGEVRKTPTPKEDFEAFTSPEPPKLELPVSGKPVTAEMMDLVQQRINFLQQLGWFQNISCFFHSNAKILEKVKNWILHTSKRFRMGVVAYHTCT